MGDSIALWIIVLQGFAVCYFEWSVWAMNKDRFEERKAWRLAKQKTQLKKTTQGEGTNAV